MEGIVDLEDILTYRAGRLLLLQYFGKPENLYYHIW